MARLLGDGHAEAGVRVGATGLSRASLVDVKLLAVDGADGTLPAAESLLEVEVDGLDDIVSFTRVEGMGFLLTKLAVIHHV